MKTGIELIAEKRDGVKCSHIRYWEISRLIDQASYSLDFGHPNYKIRNAVHYLSEAGALIAAEIDRINKLSTK